MKKKQINIVYIITSLEVGGAQSVLYSLITGLPDMQFAHHVIYFHDGPYVQKLRDAGVALYHISGFIKTYDPVFCVRLLRIVKKLRPDLIHTVLWSANLYGRFIGFLLRIPIVVSMHNAAFYNGWVRNTIDAVTWFGFTHAVAVSDLIKDSYAQKNSFLFSYNMSVIINGIDTKRAPIKVWPTSNQATNNQFVIGTVGRLIPVKRHYFLIKSFALLVARHPYAQLIVVGDGPERARLKKLVYELNVESSVHFTGQQNSYDWYPVFDCFVLSSQPESNDSNGSSIALLEAMSCGLPSVVTCANQHHPVINSGVNGSIVVHDNEQKLANALEVIMLSDLLQKKYTQEAVDTVRKKFCQTKMVQQYADLFIKIVLNTSI